MPSGASPHARTRPPWMPRRWCHAQTVMRLSRALSPPQERKRMWWSCRFRREEHAGTAHRHPSRAKTGSRWRGCPSHSPFTCRRRFSSPCQSPSDGPAKVRIAVRKRDTTDTGARKTISASGYSQSGRAHICRSSMTRVAPGGGGAIGVTPSRMTSAHSASSESRRTVTSLARAIHSAPVRSLSTGRIVCARTHDSSPARYASARPGVVHVFRSSTTSARALRADIPSRSRR